MGAWNAGPGSGQGEKGARSSVQRRWANILLAITLGVFLLSLFFRHLWVARWVATAALASLAGGVADWFAVTALFRHPLGLTWLPHTSIIARNRDRIIDAIVVMVERELLSKQYLSTVLAKVDVVELAGEVAETLAKLVHTAEFQERLLQWLQWAPLESWAERLGSWLAVRAEAWSAADLGVNLLKWLIQTNQDRALFHFLAAQAESVLNSLEFTDEMEARLKSMIDNYTRTTTQKLLLGLLESLGTIDYKELSQVIRLHLLQWIHSESAFQQFELALVRIMIALRDDEKVRAAVEAGKRDLLQQIPWRRLGQVGRQEAEQAIAGGAVGRWLAEKLGELRPWLEADPARAQWLAGEVRGVATQLVERYHPWIGKLVRDNLNQMNQQEWIDKLEWYVGRDLQWIRINGTIVGGIVGVGLTVLLQLAGIRL